MALLLNNQIRGVTWVFIIWAPGGKRNHSPYRRDYLFTQLIEVHVCVCPCAQFLEGYRRSKQKSSLENRTDWGRSVFPSPVYTLLS